MVSKAAQAAAEQRTIRTAKQQVDAWENAAGTLEKVAKIATEKISERGANSQLLSKDLLDAIPKFVVEELSLGRVLGKGGFGTVNEIRFIQCKNDSVDIGPGASSHDDDGLKDQELQDKKFIADHCIREGGDSRYCVKALSPEVIADKNLFTQGVIDMAVETLFLSVVSHPHIVTMRAFGANGMLKPNYFIVLDRLYDTLEARIPKWRLQSKRAKSVVNKMRRTSSGKLDELMETKLCYAYDLMGAFDYLHKKKLVYRDLKPENVGFNIRDDIVLFDFGLAREIQDEGKVTDSTWKLTGETGSLRYMAPEVASNKPYGYSADMYSFGIMLWQMLKMETPFAQFNKKMHSELIVHKGGRPKLEESWGPSLRGFLNSCWHQDLTKRPTAAKASAILKREAAKVAGGSGLELNNFRRKSTFVNRDSLRERASTGARMNEALSMSSSLEAQ
mmetsp:Transcript_5742/g.9799  ORF Transcript_5742/g.9799 Transcript_5742/m.9799 type:complete len:447 (-) Transcript_5742:134-1474(-)|eukprot:CAMPEP_0201888626 /NCGR_PEP_ID=MMETSP0902-20130614/28062_1 /ASSEMBLY_ACC=CAM_ASM_000551 /TAXON_ID=420261 /ORGANISM="Thalassiosira antarctica, Strain CCMP982" /LENGTH=446 /DNA_ID=CAMNT_0048418933 /DNA_START=34 /DNA_END=1374 /DNA_ORIENTATION=-